MTMVVLKVAEGARAHGSAWPDSVDRGRPRARAAGVWAGKGLPTSNRARRAATARSSRWAGRERSRAWIGPSTRVIEARAAASPLPGFNDAHVHFLAGGSGSCSVDLRGAGRGRCGAPIGVTRGRCRAGTWILAGELGPRGLALEGPAHAPGHRRRHAGPPGLRAAPRRAHARWPIPSPCGSAGVTARQPDPHGGTIVRDAAGRSHRRPQGQRPRPRGARRSRAVAGSEPARGPGRPARRRGWGSRRSRTTRPVDALPTYRELRARAS